MKQKGKILIVEDEAMSGLALNVVLKRWGYKICGVVPRGDKAIKMAETEKPDLVVMDILLAGQIDGIQAAEQIRAKTNIPIVFLTGYQDEETVGVVKSLAPSVFIIKPTDPDEIAMTIEKTLEKYPPRSS